MRRWFARLRIDAETAVRLMRIDPDFAIDEFTQKLVELRQRYGDGVQLLKSDFLLTSRRKASVQDDVDKHFRGLSG
jgi:hypothetical protein